MKRSFLLLLIALFTLAGVNVISSGMAPPSPHETISIDKLGTCPPKSKQQGKGPTQWTEQRDMDGDGIPDWKWNKEYVDSDGKKVTVGCFSKEDGQFALVYEDKIVGLCPYEKGRNRATLTKDKPGGKYIKTEWFSRDRGQDDDGDKRADEMVYTYDVATDKLTALNRESNPKRDEIRQTTPPRLGSGELPVAFGISQKQLGWCTCMVRTAGCSIAFQPICVACERLTCQSLPKVRITNLAGDPISGCGAVELDCKGNCGECLGDQNTYLIVRPISFWDRYFWWFFN